MNDPHVVALFYEIEHDIAVDYSDANPIDHEEPGFRLRMEDKRARVERRPVMPRRALRLMWSNHTCGVGSCPRLSINGPERSG